MSESLQQMVQIPMEVANKDRYMHARVHLYNAYDGVSLRGVVYEMHCLISFSLVAGCIQADPRVAYRVRYDDDDDDGDYLCQYFYQDEIEASLDHESSLGYSYHHRSELSQQAETFFDAVPILVRIEPAVAAEDAHMHAPVRFLDVFGAWCEGVVEKLYVHIAFEQTMGNIKTNSCVFYCVPYDDDGEENWCDFELEQLQDVLEEMKSDDAC